MRLWRSSSSFRIPAFHASQIPQGKRSEEGREHSVAGLNVLSLSTCHLRKEPCALRHMRTHS